MPSTTIAYGDVAAIPFPTGQDSNGNAAPLGSLTLTVSDYTDFYPAQYGNTTAYIVPKPNTAVSTPGSSTPVTATFQATDEDGNALPPLVYNFLFVGAPTAPLAVTLVSGTPTAVTEQGTSFSNDPGSATLTLAV